MVWFIDPKSISALGELEQGSDRTIGVVAGAIIDSNLTDALRNEFRRDETSYSANIANNVFQPDGPLGNFGAKIWIAYLLGYFTQDAHDDLQNLTYLRNRFAHYSENNSFENQNIKDRCANFKLVNELVRPSVAGIKINNRSISAVSFISVTKDRIYLNIPNHQKILKTAKGRFVCTAKLFCAALVAYGKNQLKKPI